MNIEKMREEFEAWAKQKGLSIGLNWNNSYSHVALIAWDAWQASRESLVDNGRSEYDRENKGECKCRCDQSNPTKTA